MGKKLSLDFRQEKKSEVILNTGLSRVNLVSLDAGETVETHRAKVPATAIVIEGEITFWANDEEFNLKPGEIILLDANEPHSLRAVVKSNVLVTRLAESQKESGKELDNKKTETKIADQIPECNH